MIKNKNTNIHVGQFRKSVLGIVLIVLSGCALFPPQPPGCQGEFKPVNGDMESRTGRTGGAVKGAQGASNGK